MTRMNYIQFWDVDNIVSADLLNTVEGDIKNGVDTAEDMNWTLQQLLAKMDSLAATIQQQQATISQLQQQMDGFKSNLNDALATFKGRQLVSFMDDDISEELLTHAKVAWDSAGIHGSLSAPFDSMDSDGSLTYSQLQALKTAGHAIMNHSRATPTFTPLNTDALMSRFKAYFDQIGLIRLGTIMSDIVVYQNGNIDPHPDVVKQLVGKYMKYALNVTGSINYPSTIDALDIHRMYLCVVTGPGTWMEDELWRGAGYTAVYDGDGNRSWVQDPQAEKGWAVLFTHSWMLSEDNGDLQFSQEKLEGTIALCKQLGYRFVTVPQALMILLGLPSTSQ